MKFTTHFIFLISLTLVLCGVSYAQIEIFSEAQGTSANGKIYDFEKWSFSLDKEKYEITKDGQGKRTDEKNRTKTFSISLEGAEFLDRAIYFAEYKNDLLLISELDFGESGASFIVRLDGNTLETKWRKRIPSFNAAKGLIEENSAYLAATGFVGKINLDTGNYVWKHDDIYRKYKESGAFNIFEVPKIEKNWISFTENQDSYERSPNKIIFDKYSGKVIKVKVDGETESQKK